MSWCTDCTVIVVFSELGCRFGARLLPRGRSTSDQVLQPRADRPSTPVSPFTFSCPCEDPLLPLPSLTWFRSSVLPEREVVESITAWFPRLHSLVVGPGLGRDPLVLSRVKKLILAAKEMQKNIVIDAVSHYISF